MTKAQHTPEEDAAAKVQALLDDAQLVLDGLRDDDRDPDLQAYVAAQIPVLRAALAAAWGFCK
jgi:hypothetical protein